jgi:hypothetical protein
MAILIRQLSLQKLKTNAYFKYMRRYFFPKIYGLDKMFYH